MTEDIETRMNRLEKDIRQFSVKVQADQRNRKQTTPAAEVTAADRIADIHDRKSVPSRYEADPNAPPVTAIILNGQTVEDFGNRERTYGSTFIASGGKEFNLRNNNDRYNFLQMFWPDHPRDQLAGIINTLMAKGRVTRDQAPELVLQLKAGHVVIAAEDLPH